MRRTTQPPKAAPSIIKEINPHASARDLSTQSAGHLRRLPAFLRPRAPAVAILAATPFVIRGWMALFWR